MDTTELHRAGSWRFDQLADLPDDGRRYEVVDGLLVVSPPPSPRHQFVAAALIRQLDRQNPGGWHVLHELALPMGADGRVPDVAVVSADAPCMGEAPLEPAHFGLVIEVVSPSSRKTDRFAKPGEYAEADIPLYWRVETDPALLLVAYRLLSGTYEQVAAVDHIGSAPVPWGEATLDLDAIRGAG